MKNFLRITNVKTTEDVVLFNLDKFVGRLAFAFMVVGIVDTCEAVKNVFKKKENDING